MPYQVTVWCSDCYNEDFLGCFDGGTEIITIDPDSGESIATQERADQIGHWYTRSCGSWDYEVSEIVNED